MFSLFLMPLYNCSHSLPPSWLVRLLRYIAIEPDEPRWAEKRRRRRLVSSRSVTVWRRRNGGGGGVVSIGQGGDGQGEQVQHSEFNESLDRCWRVIKRWVTHRVRYYRSGAPVKDRCKCFSVSPVRNYFTGVLIFAVNGAFSYKT